MALNDDESAAAREAAIASFAQKFPIDERAKDRLRCLPEDALRRVFDDFRPAADSNPDFSRRLVGFLKGFNTGSGPPASNPFGSLAPNLMGGGSFLNLGLVESSSSVPTEQLELFRSSYPMDARAFDFLKIVPAEVQARVITTFKPPAVQADYSRIVTAHIRFCLNQHREQQQLVSSHSVASLLAGQQQASTSSSASALLAGLLPALPAVPSAPLLGGGTPALAALLGQTPGSAETTLALLLGGTPGLAQLLSGGSSLGLSQPHVALEEAHAAAAVAAMAAAQQPAEHVLSQEQLELFRQSYPMDARAFDFLKIVPPEVQQRVISTFKPPAVQADYSRIVTSHIRFCLNQHREAQSSLQAAAAPFLLGNTGTAALLSQVATADLTGAVAGAVSQDQLTVFRSQYPMDERAYDYLKMAPSEVQKRVISSFNPPAVQADYSKLVTAHVKFCLMQQREHGSSITQAAPQHTVPQVASDALVPAGGAAEGSSTGSMGLGLAQLAAATQGMVSTRSSVSSEELELFRSMYPMDDRAYDYLAGAPPEVQERVVDTFNVSEVQVLVHSGGAQADYSRAVTAHVKFCLKQHKEQVPALIALPAGTDAAQAVTMLAEFRQKFPTDDRAWNYLLQSSAEVKQRVLTEFCPPAGVEGDYSKAVTAYIRRCRDDEKSRQSVPAVAAAAGDLSAVLGQGSSGLAAALLRAQAVAAAAPTAAVAAAAAAWLGTDDGSAAKRLRTEASSSGSFERAALALTGAHWTAT